MTEMHVQNLHNPIGMKAGHIALIVGVAAALVSLALFKNPARVQLSSRTAAGATVASPGAPKYYSYSAPAEPNVLGVTTEHTSTGPSILNEDGTFSPANIGEVLGVNSESVELSAEGISVRTVPNSQQAVRGYFSYMQHVESRYLNPAELETALSSNNSSQLIATSNKIKKLVGEMLAMYVPQEALKLHQLTVVQYKAAVELLNNYSQLESNPDLVNSKLGMFMQAESAQDQEMQTLLTKYQIASYAAQ